MRRIVISVEGTTFSVEADNKEDFVRAFRNKVDERIDFGENVGEYEDMTRAELTTSAGNIWDADVEREASATENPTVRAIARNAEGEEMEVEVYVSDLKKDSTGSSEWTVKFTT